MAVYQTTALILRHTTDREHDRYIVALSPDHGQLRLRARGTKKSTSKLGGSLEPLCLASMTIANGKVVDQVIGSVLQRRFSGLRRDPISIVAAQWLLELIEHVSKPGQESAALYAQAIAALTGLEQDAGLTIGQRWLRILRAGWMVLDVEGFAPSLEHCGRCHQSLGVDQVRWHVRHGFMHAAHADADAVAVPPETLDFLSGRAVANDRDVFVSLQPIFSAVLHHALDRPLRSDPVLRSMMKLEQLQSR